MGIDTESNVEASLQIGPTEKGMVRLYVSNNSIEIPMDFEPEEAKEIADEILSAAKVQLYLKIQVGVNLIAIWEIWITNGSQT